MRPLNLSECFCLFSCSKWYKIKFYNVGSRLVLPRHVMAMDTSFSDIHGCCLSCLWAATMHSFIFAHMQCRHSQRKSRKNMAKHPLYSFQSPQQPTVKHFSLSSKKYIFGVGQAGPNLTDPWCQQFSQPNWRKVYDTDQRKFTTAEEIWNLYRLNSSCFPRQKDLIILLTQP